MKLQIVQQEKGGPLQLVSPDLDLNVKVDDRQYAKFVQRRHVTALLPAGLRWVSANRRYAIVEEPPRVRTLHMRWSARPQHADNQGYETFTDDGRKGASFDLLMPWVVYGVSIDANFPQVTHAFARFTMFSKNAWLYDLPLPNLYNTGKICGSGLDLAEQNLDIAGALSVAIDDFWSSLFNLDLAYYESTTSFSSLQARWLNQGGTDRWTSVWQFWEDKLRDLVDLAPPNVNWKRVSTVKDLATQLTSDEEETGGPQMKAGARLMRFLTPAHSMLEFLGTVPVEL
jgi:hypothetical protein